MKVKIDTDSNILYLEESVTYSELQKLCKKLGIDDSWRIEPIINDNYISRELIPGDNNPYCPKNPYPQSGITPYNPWEVPITTYYNDTAKNS